MTIEKAVATFLDTRTMQLTAKGRGACAFMHRQPLSDNPHPAGTGDHELWQEGWVWAQEAGLTQDEEVKS